MSMGKLKKCRICLVENVEMYVVADKNLQEIYEKLTDVPFVTEDSRPTLACVSCCSKLKQSYQLQRKCLEAEKLFSHMLNDYETKPLINQDPLEFSGGFNVTPTVHISIVDACQAESIAIKEELPDVSEGLDDIIEPKQEPQSDELELENKDDSCLDAADIQPPHSESNLEVNVSLLEIKIEVEEEQEVFKNKRRASDTTRTTVAKKPKLDTRRTKLEDAKTAEKTKKGISDSKVIRIIQKRTSEPGTYFKEPYECDQRSFNPVKKITQHISTQIVEKPFKCDVCQRGFSQLCHLKKHILTHTGEKPYKCDVCQRSFGEKGALTKHIRIHTGEKPFKCDICQSSFRQNGHLTNHIRQHTGEKPYKCYVCQRGFSEKGHLSQHIRTHTGEKPYKCDVCQSRFSQKGHLTKHTRIHTGENPYKCDLCQRSFYQKSALTNHIRVHTGDKPYKCNVCQRNFNQKGYLNKHMRIHTGEKPLKRVSVVLANSLIKK